MQHRLTRSRSDRMIAGVCGGLGQYFGIDPVIVRLIFVVVAITTVFITPVLYPILWLVIPEEGQRTPTMPLPPDARFDPMTGQPLPPTTGQTVNLGQIPPQSAPGAAPRGRNRTLGFILVGIGGIALLNNVGDAISAIFGFNLSSLIFPLLLVGLGVYLLRKTTV
jgi:phage shock protein C